MSADLFAAFGSDEQSAWSEAQTTTSDDVRPQMKPSDKYTPTEYSQATGSPWEQPTKSAKESLWSGSQEGTQVLFDADEDDFGDFEEVKDHRTVPNELQSPATQPQSTFAADTERFATTMDLLGWDDSPIVPTPRTKTPSTAVRVVTQQSTQIVGLPSTLNAVDEGDGWGDFEQVGHVQGQNLTTLKSGSPQELRQPYDDDKTKGTDDGWQQFEDGVIAKSTNAASEKSSVKTKAASKEQQQQQERPYNVPPPAILLGVLPSVFDHLNSDLEPSNLTKSEIATKILIVFHVSGRIIAGRSLRWKRDTILIQSMKIGQAGKSGGMKLTAVNKGEAAKEEQEAAEAIESWLKYAHRFNSALARANISRQPMKISLSMPIKTLAGAISGTGVDYCPICGLKRAERVAGVDVDVQDLFGEFWMEKWGHKECSEFWYQYNYLLNQR